MKIISFNVNGIRAIVQKNFIEDMKSINADVICLQETKATAEQVKEAVASLSEYTVYANQAARLGYSGTAILTKIKPIKIIYDLDAKDPVFAELDSEGRVTCAEFSKFYLVCVYTPNSGSELLRLPHRKEWDVAFLTYVQNLEKTKPVFVCGDLNVAHKDIDLARPKPNYNKSAGYMQEEIDAMDNFENANFKDTFRQLNPTEIKYSWFSYRGGAREKNVGWRIDYFLASRDAQCMVKESFILNEIMGSDHCPVGIELVL